MPSDSASSLDAKPLARVRSLYTPLTIVALSLAFGLAGWARRWTGDDGFSNFRVVENLISGHGPIFNLGERVEAVTSVLWIWLLAAPTALGVRVEHASVALGLAFGTVALALAQWAALRARRPAANTLPLPVGAVLYAALPVAWDFATSGLEVSLSLLWLAGSAALAARELERTGSAKLAALVVGLGPLVRPELGLYAVAWGVWLLIVVWRRSGRSATPVITTVSCGSAIPLGYQLFRMGYFAALVPTTALAKEAVTPFWSRGASYLIDFFSPYLLIAPLLAALPVSIAAFAMPARDPAKGRGLASARGLWALTATTALLHALYVVRLGGDFMHGRMLLLPLFAWLLPVAMVPVPKSWSLRTVGAALVAIWALWMMADPPMHEGDPEAVVNERRYYQELTGRSHPVLIEDYQADTLYLHALDVRELAAERCPDRSRCSPVVLRGYDLYRSEQLADVYPFLARVRLPDEVGAVALRTRIGVFSYAAGPAVRVVDLLGLSDPLAARAEMVVRGRPGHEKVLPPLWFYAYYGELPEDLQRHRDVAVARTVLQCAPLLELRAAVSEPLSWKRFARNVALAPRLHRLRFHPIPARARQQLCDAAPPRGL